MTVKELRMHRNWISEMTAQTHELAAIAINFYLEPTLHTKACEAELLDHQDKITSIDNVDTVNVYHCANYHKHGDTVRMDWEFSGEKTLILSSCVDSGELVKIEGGNPTKALRSGELAQYDAAQCQELMDSLQTSILFHASRG
jgi:hypothetical protein